MADSAVTIFIAAVISLIVIAVTVILLVVFKTSESEERGYAVLHNGTEYIQIYVLNEKGHKFVESLLDAGWDAQVSGKQGEVFTLLPPRGEK